ncbi:hypothetical protein PROFUN_10734 [Planoprotostelium fungivorum]|uniref:Uncharacterized protein n=1 Tax=Planoprotostelium fungivorum TaxID=1890364 RepID=A0A2P6N7Y1_9EUKA|nr:hypothetical protein PROFUN_10734 [Planoprotostelium fungivorum]
MAVSQATTSSERTQFGGKLTFQHRGVPNHPRPRESASFISNISARQSVTDDDQEQGHEDTFYGHRPTHDYGCRSITKGLPKSMSKMNAKNDEFSLELATAREFHQLTEDEDEEDNQYVVVVNRTGNRVLRIVQINV